MLKNAWKTNPGESSIRKTYKYLPGTAALREICKLQKSTNLLSRKKPFVRLVREIAPNVRGTAFNSENEWLFKPETIKVLKVACEDFLTELNEDSKLCAIHAKRVTLQHNNIELAVKLRRDEDKISGLID